MENKRCSWVHDDYEREYHDHLWGRPVYDDSLLFEMLILEGMQAGLSWNLILRRREAMQEAFDGFDPEVVSQYGSEKIAELLENPGIIRNRRKLEALPKNAKAFLAVKSEFGSFSAYLWGFVDGRPILNAWERQEEVPATAPVAHVLSKDLKKRGFSFVGPTIVYSYMQAVGLVNDHLVCCPQYRQCIQAGETG